MQQQKYDATRRACDFFFQLSSESCFRSLKTESSVVTLTQNEWIELLEAQLTQLSRIQVLRADLEESGKGLILKLNAKKGYEGTNVLYKKSLMLLLTKHTAS